MTLVTEGRGVGLGAGDASYLFLIWIFGTALNKVVVDVKCGVLS